MNDTKEYIGTDNLKIMKNAHHYNMSLVNLVCQFIRLCGTTDSQTTIIDFGSGDSFFARMIQRKINHKIKCIEPAKNLRRHYTGLTLLDNLNNLPNNSVDILYSLNVLEHIEDDTAIVQDFARVLKQGGSILLYLPACPSLYSCMDKAVGHYRRYTPTSLMKLFSDSAWKINRIAYSDFCGSFVTLLFKLIGNNQGKISPNALFIYDNFIFPISSLVDKITHGKLIGKNIIIEVTKR